VPASGRRSRCRGCYGLAPHAVALLPEAFHRGASGEIPDVTQPPQDDPHSNDDPDPASTPGLEPGGGVAPGDTPPNAGQMSGTAPDAHKGPNMGPVSGNRTPMFIGLGFIAVIVLMVAVLTGASFFAS